MVSLEGYAMVFRFENNAWTPLGSTIFEAASAEASTNALSDDGSIVAVGGQRSSTVRVFSLADDDWEPYGDDITNPSGGKIGQALAISGDGTILAASSLSANNFAGEVHVFELLGDYWSQKGRTLKGQEGEELNFGEGVSLSQDGSVLAVGIPGYGNVVTNGHVRVIEFVDNDWIQIGQALQGTNVGNNFGNDVALSSDGQTLAVGSPDYSDGSSLSLGSVHIYRLGSGGKWFEPGSILIGKSANEHFGASVALSGDATILVARCPGLLRFFEADGNE